MTTIEQRISRSLSPGKEKYLKTKIGKLIADEKKTYEVFFQARDFRSQRIFNAGVYAYRYNGVGGNRYIGKFNNDLFSPGWKENADIYPLLSIINNKAEILTLNWASSDVKSCAGLCGVISGERTLKSLEDYMSRHGTYFGVSMVRVKFIESKKELKSLIKTLEKNEVKDPFLTPKFVYDPDEDDYFEKSYDGSYGLLHTLKSMAIMFDEMVSPVGYTKAFVKKFYTDLRNKMAEEDLYFVSFLAAKPDDDYLFSMLSRFKPRM